MSLSALYQQSQWPSVAISVIPGSLSWGCIEQLSNPRYNIDVQGRCTPGSLFAADVAPAAGICGIKLDVENAVHNRTKHIGSSGLLQQSCATLDKERSLTGLWH